MTLARSKMVRAADVTGTLRQLERSARVGHPAVHVHAP